MEFFDSLRQVKSNWQPYKKWEAEQDNKEFQRQELHKRIPTSKEDLEKASAYGRTLIDSINIMDQYSINKAEDVETASEIAMQFFGLGLAVISIALSEALIRIPKIKRVLEKKIQNEILRKALPSMLTPVALALTISPILTVKFASFEKEASRIARYQAREEELKDPKNFVIYNDEQIEEAKKIAKTLPEPVEQKKSKLNPIANYSDSIKSIKTLIKDHKNYLNWKQVHLKNEKKRIESVDNMEISSEQIKTAKKDQNNLLRAIRKIEINSQNYLANTEMACNIMLGGSLIVGALGGGMINGLIWLLGKLNFTSQSSKLIQNMKSFSGPLGALGLTLLASSYTIKLQKDAAKVGRFKAKQELLKDPHNFINYSDEQMDSVKNLKAPVEAKKGIFSRLKNGMKFYFQLVKDSKEYKKYQKVEGKEELKLQEALKQINVSEQQIKDAKKLQKNSFMSFEKIDEMTQRYVDDTEAATDIGKKYIETGVNIIAAAFFFMKNKKGILEGKNIFSTTKDFLKIMMPFLFAGLIEIPIELQSNKIKKEAGKIGTMKAMKDLEDPKHFIQN